MAKPGLAGKSSSAVKALPGTGFGAALYIHDLDTGKTCADRKAAIPTLVEVGGDEAIKALKRARYRGRGGVLGIGESNANACLKTEAELAIQKLQKQD